MKMIKQVLAAVAVAGAILSPMASHAEGMNYQENGHHCGGYNEHHQWGHGLEHAVKFLNLTSEQQDKVFQIVHQNEPQLYQNHKTIRESRKELRDMTMAASYDNAKVLVLSNQIGSAIASSIAIRSQMNRQIYDLLSVDQKHKLTDMKKKFQEHHDRFKSGN